MAGEGGYCKPGVALADLIDVMKSDQKAPPLSMPGIGGRCDGSIRENMKEIRGRQTSTLVYWTIRLR